MSHESLDSCWQTEYSSEGSETGCLTPELTDSLEDGESETSSEPPATPPILIGPDFRSRPEIYTPLAPSGSPNDKILPSKIFFRPINNSYIASDTCQSPSTTHTSSQDATDRDRRRAFKRRGGHMVSDRFISIRGLIDSLPTQFQVGRNPLELSNEEKFLRHRPLSEDPFMPTRPRRPLSSLRVPSIRPHYGPHFVNDLALMGDRGPDGLRRQISAGAVWNVGGSSAASAQPPAAVFSGANLRESGTTAPMHAARFLSPAASIERVQKYQSRVALALDLDPAARVLTSSGIWPLLEITPNPSSPNYERLSPLVWKENAWKRAERGQCKFNVG
ncbi:hypothetical protein BDW42DRAFT_183178 [Aspergillus taichungensis]|uniref:Uncharacterized protein n=1 Tax=Aspergillus taichungensis TaxID=482145 RepID=A0A2J5I5H5_9EURO|nr:hypothetical protein BDW42DRAFT_183178 [Aspergillus taichungensis]